MFLSKLALYGTIAGSFFAVSAFSTVQITKQMNKTPVPNEVTEEEEEEEVYVRQMSDTERFINSLTAFGNMEGNLNATVTKGDYTLTLKGDVFVSMESMDDIKVNADLTLNALNRDFNIKATYLDGTVYTTLEGNNLKLNTSSLGEITSMFSTMESSIELPEAFKNIDTNQLITNLSAMSAEKSDDHITYTCNLLEGIPPIIFTSDLEYKMTSVSISNCEIEGFKIDVNATTKILGKGHNKVVSPETEENTYTDITSYFGTIKQIKSLIDAKEAGINYGLTLSKSGNNIISTTGTANVSLANGLELDVNGKLYNGDKSKSVTYGAGYQGNNAYLNFNDLIKVYYDVNHFEDLTSSITALLNNEDIAKLLANLESVELPIVKMINNKDYNGLLDQYKGIYLSKDQIKVTLSNSIFSDNNSNFDVVVNLDENGIKDINIVNLRYNDYALTLSLELKEYKKNNVDLSTYDNVSNVDKVIDQINNLISSKKFNLNITDISYGDYSISGTVQADIVNHTYQADVNIQKATVTKNELDEDEVSYTNYRIRLDADDTYYYLAYSDDRNSENPAANDVKLAISRNTINDTIESVKSLLNNKDAELTKLVDALLAKFKDKLETSSKDINVVDILFEDYLKSFDIVKDEVNNTESLNVVVNGSKVGLESDINLNVGLDQNTHISSLNGNLDINAKNLNFALNLNDFATNYSPIPVSERPEVITEGNTNVGGWVGADHISNVVRYVTELDNATQTAVVNQIKDLIENKEVGIDYDINVYKKTSTDTNELIFNMNGDFDLSIGNTKDINSFLISLSGNMNNNDVNKLLDSDIDIKLYEGALYFNYNDRLKLAYEISDIESLIGITKEKITGNTTTEVADLLKQLFPNHGDTNNSAIVDIVKGQNYLSIINYYKDAYKDENNALNVVFDGSLIGNPNTDIVFKLKAGNNGISNITLNGVYALGYTLDINLDITNYTAVTMTNEEKASYTNLKYINNIFEKVADLINKDKFAITLDGKMNLGKGDITLNGSSFVSLSEAQDFGVADLTINASGKEHHVQIDVTRNKVSKDATEAQKNTALESSDILFVYNNDLKGKLNLKSVSDTFDLIKRLASDGNPLLDRIKGLLTRDSTQSTLNKVMAGEPEAILYDNSLESITYDVDTTTGGYYYDIQLSGNLLKSDSTDVADPIHIYINLDNNHNFTGIGIKGMLNTYSLDIDLGISDAENNTISWNRLNPAASYLNFSKVDVLAEYLFNTGAKRDFTIDGDLVISIIGDIKIPMNAKIKVEKSNTNHEDVYAQVEIGYFKDLEGISTINPFAQRKFIMYIIQTEKKVGNEIVKNEMVHIDVLRKNSLRSDKHITLTMEQFNEKPVYWICDYGLGFSVDSSDSSSTSNINFAKLITSFNYTAGNNPKWTIGVDLSQLVSILNTATVTITGDGASKTLAGIDVSTSVVGINIGLDAELDINTVLGESFKTTVAGKMA